MTDLQRPQQSVFIQELQRLVNVYRSALRAKDIPAIDDAAHDLKTFLRLNDLGRIGEWWAKKEQA